MRDLSILDSFVYGGKEVPAAISIWWDYSGTWNVGWSDDRDCG